MDKQTNGADYIICLANAVGNNLCRVRHQSFDVFSRYRLLYCPCRAVGQLSLCSVCSNNNFRTNDLRLRYVAFRFILTLSGSNSKSKVKVQGHKRTGELGSCLDGQPCLKSGRELENVNRYNVTVAKIWLVRPRVRPFVHSWISRLYSDDVY